MKSSIKCFLPLQRLGEGSFASVYKVKRISDDQVYALKKIKMGKLCQKSKENALNEVRLLASLSCDYITTYYQAFFDEQLDSLCIVMQYASKGDLRKMINHHKKMNKMISEVDIWKFLIHLLYGLKVLHDNKILHRDLKCQNIFVFDDKYKIGDMNVSKINKKGFVETQTGTPYYASPEVWKDNPYDQKSDIWSLGCILHEMATLNPPFTGNSMHQLYRNITKSKQKDINQCYSHDLASIISKCLKKIPSERPQVQELLNHLTVKLYENICIHNLKDNAKINQMSASINLLQTINFPKNIKELNSILPESNYKKFNTENKKDLSIQRDQSKKNIQKQYINRKQQKIDQINTILQKEQKIQSLRALEPKEVRLTTQNQEKDQKEQKIIINDQIYHVKAFNQNKDIEASASKKLQQSSCQNEQMHRIINSIQIKSTNKQMPQQKQTKNDNQKQDKSKINKRRILKIIQNADYEIIKPQKKSRSKSLPRTENRLRSISKDSTNIKPILQKKTQRQKEDIHIIKIIEDKIQQNQRPTGLSMEKKINRQKQQKNRYYKVVQLAKKCLEKSYSRRHKIF